MWCCTTERHGSLDFPAGSSACVFMFMVVFVLDAKFGVNISVQDVVVFSVERHSLSSR